MTIFVYARVSTGGHSVKQLRVAGAETVFKETASAAKTDRAQSRRAIDALGKAHALLMRLSTGWRDRRATFLNTLDAIAKAGAGFRSLSDSWADTTTRTTD